LFYGIYRLLTRLLFSLFFPAFLVYVLLSGRHRTGLWQRLGYYGKKNIQRSDGPTVWLHGASVGEIKAAEPLLGKLTEIAPSATLVVTTATEQGFKLARQNLGEKAVCLIAPLDLPGAANRAIEAIEPDLYICLETELWPNTLINLRTRGVACFLLNARLSEGSFRRYRRFGNFVRQVLSSFSGIAAISNADAERLVALGAAPERISVSGNIKYDLPPFPEPEMIRQEWQRALDLRADTPVLVAGSTHGGEELLLLKAFRSLQPSLPGLVLILAPRHLERLGAAQAELDNAGAEYDLLSRVRKSGRHSEIVVVDTMGELSTLYSVATFSFCGGSLVDCGGHNVFEAARWGHPVFYGPSMNDFSDAKEVLETGGGGFQVENISDLAERIRQLSSSPDLYRRAAEAARLSATTQNGAVERQLKPVLAALGKMAVNKKIQPASLPA